MCSQWRFWRAIDNNHPFENICIINKASREPLTTTFHQICKTKCDHTHTHVDQYNYCTKHVVYI